MTWMKCFALSRRDLSHSMVARVVVATVVELALEMQLEHRMAVADLVSRKIRRTFRVHW